MNRAFAVDGRKKGGKVIVLLVEPGKGEPKTDRSCMLRRKKGKKRKNTQEGGGKSVSAEGGQVFLAPEKKEIGLLPVMRRER